MPNLRDVEDTRPLPGIEWDLDVKRDVAQRFGVSTQAIGAAVQLVTDGIFVGRYRPADSNAAGGYPRALSKPGARHPCARSRARGDRAGHGADQHLRERARRRRR